jgi:hypothetical protein
VVYSRSFLLSINNSPARCSLLLNTPITIVRLLDARRIINNNESGLAVRKPWCRLHCTAW